MDLYALNSLADSIVCKTRYTSEAAIIVKFTHCLNLIKPTSIARGLFLSGHTAPSMMNQQLKWQSKESIN